MPTRASPAPPVNPKDLIEGLGKGLRVIESFDDDHARQTVSEAAQRAGITRTAARRHLLSLVHFGYAASDGKLYWLTPRVLRLGQGYLGTARLPRLVQPFIQQISQKCGETVNVSVIDDHEVVYVARSSPPRFLSIGYQVGVRMPAHAVTPGVVMLAAMSDRQLDDWIAQHDFVGFTAHTVTDPALFRQHVLEARALDCWITGQQIDFGLRGLAVPLKDRKGACHGAMGMTVQTQSYSDEQMQVHLLPLLREAAQLLRQLL